MEGYFIMEKTYNFSEAERFKTIITYDLPIYLAIRFDFQYCVNIDRIGGDELLDLEKTKTYVTIKNRKGEKLMENKKLELFLYEPKTFPKKWDDVTIKVHVPGVSLSSASVFDMEFKYYDRVLLVGEENINVNSGLLSTWSEYFAVLFKETDAGKENGLIVSDVDANEFKELLQIIYPTRKDINKDNVVFIWKLADRFGMPILALMCEKYLTTLPGKYMVTLAKKHELALRVKSVKLMDDCLTLLAKMNLGM